MSFNNNESLISSRTRELKIEELIYEFCHLIMSANLLFNSPNQHVIFDERIFWKYFFTKIKHPKILPGNIYRNNFRDDNFCLSTYRKHLPENLFILK